MLRTSVRSHVQRIGHRRLHLSVSDEIREALNAKMPVVALESTIISHGLPYPENIEMALKVEQEIRNNGAIPATTAFINGIPKVGLKTREIEQLAEYARKGLVNKVSRRDISYTIAQKLYGGTTISSTMILSHKAGIEVFATGGLGGVHKGGELTLDVSADLEELGRTPVSVVCAGPKAILDIPRTMEYLETKGCMVATMGPPGTNVPGFYTRDSGVKSPYNFNSYLEAAQIIRDGNEFGLNSGYLFCCPPPREVALDDNFINDIIEQACQNAAAAGISGKELTPFLLREIASKTSGASVKCNISFVLNNCKIAANIAASLSKLKQNIIPRYEPKNQRGTMTSQETSGNEKETKVLSAVIGSVALDTQCTFNSSHIYQGDSNPGKASTSIGGVGHNVALSANYSNRSSQHQTTLISAVGKDIAGKHILSGLGMSADGIYINESERTAQYISIHSRDGELYIAGSDMDIVTQLPIKHITNKLKSLKPNVVLVDANVSVEVLEHLITLREKMGFKLIFEPTSECKAQKIAQAKNLKVYPNHGFDLITPTVTELKGIYEALDKNNKFDLDNWFPVLDSFKIDRNLSVNKKASTGELKYLLDNGIFQTASFLLPYFPRMVIKHGSKGIYIFSMEKDTDPATLELISKYSDYSMYCTGEHVGGQQQGVLVEHHAVPAGNTTVTSVTGAGDTLVGILLNEISIDPEFLELKDPARRKHRLDRAQYGARITLEDKETISKNLKELP
ncbi:pseudouridine-5'-phosphate glycosidase/carbohydrate kinase family protein [Kluyveromyces lactis]|uniref:KLLA0B04004p n=1 Tax=Kluyveromyces lactis (strain ATCC 8585 / CBS 2359 / DSM 70799 / NBRC 1267 / NRRL Y-1140 / WM37) TaxID=284590 RepID=Q6CWH7_KLULA|nr:uncharacterized protein KLLA0_B04004g [Kluyveromyces lactis]CAH02105.1 KLLA0B04004p [Kluyveromyces lactis]|eukprot:XP_451712.1 uncharacterized protein KLLA0_B04004g [Kluyveromyces lactis]